MSIADELKKLADLRESGTISFREFQNLKKKLLSLVDQASSFEQIENLRPERDDQSSQEDCDAKASSAPKADRDLKTEKHNQSNESPAFDVDVSDKELGLDEEEFVSDVPALDADVSNEELGIDDQSLAQLGQPQFEGEKSELKVSALGSSQFEKIDIPDEGIKENPDVRLDSSNLSQLDKNELIDKVAQMNRQLDELTSQHKVAQVDRAWERQKKQFDVIDQNGHRQTASKEASVFLGVVTVIIGVLWLMFTARFPGASFTFVFGLVFIAIGAGISIHSYKRAKEYERARRRYMKRRRDAARKR